MSNRLIRRPGPFPRGRTLITRIGEGQDDTGMELAMVRLGPGERMVGDESREEAWVLLTGQGAAICEGHRQEVSRSSLFDEEPFALHHGIGGQVAFEARGECELALVATPNPRPFPSRFFTPADMVALEQRDRGRLDDASWRVVRTIFDLRNRPESALVLGEVVNLPGRWSSYPPHHHLQPELYHYRFSHPRGYGHAELGETVLKVGHCDTIKILDCHDHAQVAAPGYSMYYLWAIRHLPGAPYRQPEFNPDHDWLREGDPPPWRPPGTN